MVAGHRFTTVTKTIPDSIYTGVEDDTVDDTPDVQPATLALVEVKQFDEVYERRD